jgi:hypothetical protein
MPAERCLGKKLQTILAEHESICINSTADDEDLSLTSNAVERIRDEEELGKQLWWISVSKEL